MYISYNCTADFSLKQTHELRICVIEDTRQAIRYARYYNKLILVWYDPIRIVRDTYEHDSELSKFASKAIPHLKRYFVRGAPAMLTDNITYKQKLVNGTKHIYIFILPQLREYV